VIVGVLAGLPDVRSQLTVEALAVLGISMLEVLLGPDVARHEDVDGEREIIDGALGHLHALALLLHGHVGTVPAEVVLVGRLVPARDPDPLLFFELFDAVPDLSDRQAERLREGILTGKAVAGPDVMVIEEPRRDELRARPQAVVGDDRLEEEPLREEVAVVRHARTRFAFGDTSWR